MSSSVASGETPLAPDDAFAILGDEIRMEIIQTLGRTREPMSFSDLFDQVALSDSGQFNYHLDQLVGHFVEKSDQGYQLRQAGRRVVEAVLSGAVTEAPVMHPTPIEVPCPVCGGRTAVAYFRDRVEHYCRECEGFYENERAVSDFAADEGQTDESTQYGYLGGAQLPPAGLQGRDPAELFHAGATWLIRDLITLARGVCPRCSASLEEAARVCRDHETTGEFCDQCNLRHAIQFEASCPNCYYEHLSGFMLYLLNDGDLLETLVENGVNPVAPRNPARFTKILMDYEEELVSTEPLEARFTLSIAGSKHELTVEEDLPVIEMGES